MLLRTRTDLWTRASRYATERRIPAATVVKEILHYEILYALTQSGAAAQLAFQGGTALRLCYQGARYSEDLDFAGGQHFEPERMRSFAEILQREIGTAYDLQVDIQAPKAEEAIEGVHVARWRAKVHIPQINPSIQQHQVIHIEIASVPAHDVDLVAVAAHYPHLPEPHRQIIVAAETPKEILADKLVALGARSFLKARDVWDIKFLTDRSIVPDIALIARKLEDYGLQQEDFKKKLQTRLAALDEPDTAKAFSQEMSRFVDATIAAQLEHPTLARSFLHRAKAVGLTVLSADLEFKNAQRLQPRL